MNKKVLFGAALFRAAALLLKGDLNGALADSGKVIQIKPDWAVAYALRAGVEQAKGDLGRALADYTKAIELNKDAKTLPQYQSAAAALKSLQAEK